MHKFSFLLFAFVGKSSATTNWDELKDITCLLGVAASPVPGAAEPRLLESTLEECQAACVEFGNGCEAVALNRGAGGKFGCFFRQKVLPDKCVASLGHTSTYIKLHVFEDHTDTDCLLGPAAKTVPGVLEPVASQSTVASCQETCVATDGCEAVIVRKDLTGTGCYLRREVEVGKCHTSKGHSDLYILKASRQDNGLVEQWQVPSEHLFSVRMRLRPVVEATLGSLLFMAVTAAAVWRLPRQRCLTESAEHGASSLIDVGDDTGDEI